MISSRATGRRDWHAISLYLNERGITSSTNKHSLSLGLWSWKRNSKKRMRSAIKDHMRNGDRIMWRCKFMSVCLKIKCYSIPSHFLSHLLPPCKISAPWRNSTGNRSCCHSYCSSSVIQRNIVLKLVPVRDKIKHDADVAPKYITKFCHMVSVSPFSSALRKQHCS